MYKEYRPIYQYFNIGICTNKSSIGSRSSLKICENYMHLSICCENKLVSSSQGFKKTTLQYRTAVKLLQVITLMFVSKHLQQILTLSAKIFFFFFYKSHPQLSHKHFSQNPKHLTKITLHICVSPLRFSDFLNTFSSAKKTSKKSVQFDAHHTSGHCERAGVCTQPSTFGEN